MRCDKAIHDDFFLELISQYLPHDGPEVLAEFLVCFVVGEEFQEIGHVVSAGVLALKVGKDFDELGSVFGGLGHFSEVLDHDSDEELRHVGIFLSGFIYSFLF